MTTSTWCNICLRMEEHNTENCPVWDPPDPSTRSSSGWCEYKWWCEQCKRGLSLADHDRRQWPPQSCIGGCGGFMELTVLPLAYEAAKVVRHGSQAD